MMSAQMKMKIAFLSIVLLSGLVIFYMGLYVGHVLYGINYSLHIMEVCIQHVHDPSFVHFLAHLAFYLLIVYTLSRFVWRIHKQWILTRKWTHYFIHKENRVLTRQFNDAYQPYQTQLLIVEDDRFIALTIGLFHTRIVLSTAVLRQFSKPEIHAIVLHELHHMKNNDPLKMFIVTVLLDAIHFVPLIKNLAGYYKICIELLADRFAFTQMKSCLELGNVILKINNLYNKPEIPVGVGFASTTINYRILQILEPDKPVKISFQFVRPFTVTCIIFYVMSLLLFIEC
jgi:beta-lactamase regulating signal transducer with metallopeptidase domain